MCTLLAGPAGVVRDVLRFERKDMMLGNTKTRWKTEASKKQVDREGED